MDEVDNIILHHLRSIGCEIGASVHSLKQFTTSIFVEATARCLHAIDSSIDAPYRLPPSMAAQFRVGANIAAAVQNVGYRDDIGYHTFLYLNEKEVRRIILFLIDRMPKEHLDSKTCSSGTVVVLQKSMRAKISSIYKCVWSPLFISKQPPEALAKYHFTCLLMPCYSIQLDTSMSAEKTRFVAVNLPYISLQPLHPNELYAASLETNVIGYLSHVCHETSMGVHQEHPSVLFDQAKHIQHNSEKKKIRLRQKLFAKFGSLLVSHCDDHLTLEDLAIWHRNENLGNSHKRSRFVQVLHQQFTEAIPKFSVGVVPVGSCDKFLEQEHVYVEDSLAAVQKLWLEVTTQAEQTRDETRKLVIGIQQITEQISEEYYSISSKELVKTLKTQTVNLLPDVDANLAILEGMVDANTKRLIALSKQWERHRIATINMYRQLLENVSKTMLHRDRHVDEMAWQQTKLKELISQTRDKDEIYKQLLTEYESMIKDVNRSAYTQRIVEIVANIRKQNEDIDKVLQDTRVIQKEINFLCGKLDRIFAVTDEIIFKDAKKDDSIRKAYKFLASMHENWNALIKTVEETGLILKQIRDLDEQLEAGDGNKVVENLQRISSDVQYMQEENAALLSKVTKLSSGSC